MKTSLTKSCLLDLRVGRNLARALYEYYKTVAHIPAAFIQSLQPSVGRKKVQQGSRLNPTEAIKKILGSKDSEGEANGIISQIRASRVILEMDAPTARRFPVVNAPKSYRFHEGGQSGGSVKDSTSLDSGTQTPASTIHSTSNTSKTVSTPSLAVIDFSSLTMSRKDLRIIPKRNPASL